MNDTFLEVTRKATGATEIYETEVIQSLWSGYGKIARYNCDDQKVVIKHVKLPNNNNHPRGWNTDRSHNRKVKSYEVEVAWYKHWASFCDHTSPIPQCLALESADDEVLMVLEDLDAIGYPNRVSSVSLTEMTTCLTWLANFHATFLGEKPTHLWEVGTYWHLDTRPDELQVLEDIPLKKAATALDRRLNTSPYQTFVHGDAKLANFCFSPDGKKVAAVDFQYVGGGCGMKDVAYFIGSCLYEEDCERFEKQLLGIYFEALTKALVEKRKEVDPQAVEKEWRELYPVAWTDFHRFVKGWSPSHWKIHGYSERIAREVVAQLQVS